MSSSSRIGPNELEQAKLYALDRTSRRRTRPAFEALEGLDADQIENLVSRLSTSEDDADRALAALLAPALPPRAAAEALLAAVERESEPAVLAAVAEALRAADAGFSGAELERLAFHPSVTVRRAVAGNLYGTTDDSRFEVLLELVNDFDAEVRDWAAWALADNFPRSARRDTALRQWARSARDDSQLAARIERELNDPDRTISPPRKEAARKRGRPRYSGVEKVTVLMTTANPVDTDELALDEEVRDITASLRQTPGRDVVDLRVALAARPLDLLVELNEHRPQVLHFSGHGLPDGRLVFRDYDGYAKPVDGEAIAAALRSAGESVKVVVLNACFTAPLAEALTKYIDVAVGMERPVGDDAARVFAQAFYAALGHGSSVARAFEQARAALMLEGIPEHTIPRLVVRDGVDPSELVLTDSKLVSKPDPAADRIRLAELSERHLEHLSRHASLPVGGGIAIVRQAHETLTERAESGSLFVVGPPGAGKSGSLYHLANDLRDRGHDVVVLSADLLGAGGRRALQDELELDLDLVDALAAWPGTDAAFLLIDGLDGARGREASGVLLDVLRRVADRGGRWRVVASIRSFDLRHSPELQATMPAVPSERHEGAVDSEFAPVRHFAVAELSDTELAEVGVAFPAVGAFFDDATPELVALLRVPFNLRLLVLLLQRGGAAAARLHRVRTQLELLDVYWEHRVLAPADGRDDREETATRLCRLAVSELRLNPSRSALRAAGGAGPGLEQLLREGVVTEQRAPGAAGDRIGFAHHILFDYAFHRLVLSGEPDEIAGQLASPDVVLLARPSLVLTLLAEWESGIARDRFWRLALRLCTDDVVVSARLAAPAVFVGEARSVDDARYLFGALDRGDQHAAFLVRHVVGAVAANGLPSRPLANAPLNLWLGVASELSHRLGPDTAYAVRILVWGLTAEMDRLTDGVDQLGRVSRRLLAWGWEHDPGPSATVGVAIESAARTCQSDPVATKELLETALDPERWARYGTAELRQVADEIEYLAPCIPQFAALVYERAFGHDEQSEATTSFGAGQILRLTSTLRQDWDMVRYGLAREFPALLQTDKLAALCALRAACARESHRYRTRDVEGPADAYEASHFQIIPDDSAYWDRAGRHREGAEMLEQLEQELRAAAESSVGQVDDWLDALGDAPNPEAVWRRVFRAGALAPERLGQRLASVAAAMSVVRSRTLRDTLGELLRSAAATWTDEQVAAVEATLLLVPDTFAPERREVGEHIQAELLACLPADRLGTEQGRDLRAAAEDEGIDGPTPPFQITTSWGSIDPDEELRERGIDPTTPANALLREAVAPVSEFARDHANSAPSLEQAHQALTHVHAVRAILASQPTSADRQLLDEAQAWLSEAASALAAQTPLPVDDESVRVARDLALSGASAAIPAHPPESLDTFDRGGPSWGVPSGRIDAARALLLLCREHATADADVLAAVERLSRDPHPAVRWMVARSLMSAVGTRPEWAWDLATTIAREERSAQVREAVLHALARLMSDHPSEVVGLLRSMYTDELESAANESLLRAVSDFLVEVWIWRGHRGGRELVDEWIADISTAPARPRQVFFALRAAVTHGSSSGEHTAVRERAISVWADLTRAALDAFKVVLAEANEGPDDDRTKERASSLAALLDGSATEAYFASGAYWDSEKELSPETRERFYREASSLIDVLVDIGVPSAAHHTLQMLASFVDFDPRGVLLRIGRVVAAGRSWGYQLEGLAEAEFVRLVERYLASHRDLFVRDRESRMVLIEATHSFVEAGWPSARRLLYGFDDMFR